MSSADFQVSGTNKAALFTLKLHRGDGMCLVAMNWKKGKPPEDFVGFAIESKPPNENRFFPLNNRIAFPGADGSVNPLQLSTLISPIQKFRWVHFPRNANLDGEFTYRVTPIFMDAQDRLSQGEPQEAGIELRRETYPGQLNVTFTRGFVSSQAFVDRYEKFGPIKTLLPAKANDGLKFKPTHPKAKEALAWMGFEAREAILDALDQAIRDKAEVRVIAYDLSEPEVVGRLEKIGKRLKIIIDDSKEHGQANSGETQAAKRLAKSAGKANVKRQHMKNLQHNKSIMVNGPSNIYVERSGKLERVAVRFRHHDQVPVPGPRETESRCARIGRAGNPPVAVWARHRIADGRLIRCAHAAPGRHRSDTARRCRQSAARRRRPARPRP